MKVKRVNKEYPLDMSIYLAEVGVKKSDGRTVVEIAENEPRGEGDVHYCLVRYDDGSVIKVCRPDDVEYFPEEFMK